MNFQNTLVVGLLSLMLNSCATIASPDNEASQSINDVETTELDLLCFQSEGLHVGFQARTSEGRLMRGTVSMGDQIQIMAMVYDESENHVNDVIYWNSINKAPASHLKDD